jgi:hypothetical protein
MELILQEVISGYYSGIDLCQTEKMISVFNPFSSFIHINLVII